MGGFYMMRRSAGRLGPLLALIIALAAPAGAALGQDSADTRLRRLEAEVRAIKRQISPDGDRTVAPQETPAVNTVIAGTPATTPLADLLTRVDALEGQIAKLTAQNEEDGNKLRLLEARVAANEAALRPPPATSSDPAAAPSPSGVSSGTGPAPGQTIASDNSAAATNLEAMTGAGSTSQMVKASSFSPPSVVDAAGLPPRPQLTRATPTAAYGPSAQRLAAVRAIVRPQTGDAPEDEYSYGFRLWEAKFYPEAQQQLKMFLDKYPRHPRASYARNLMGRTLLDEGNPYEAAKWFVENYQANKRGDRAPDSLMLLAESMSRLKDTSRACIALGEFAQTYPAEAAGRLRSQYEATRRSVTCN
jgi:TolA-binding protein